MTLCVPMWSIALRPHDFYRRTPRHIEWNSPTSSRIISKAGQRVGIVETNGAPHFFLHVLARAKYAKKLLEIAYASCVSNSWRLDTRAVHAYPNTTHTTNETHRGSHGFASLQLCKTYVSLFNNCVPNGDWLHAGRNLATDTY